MDVRNILELVCDVLVVPSLAFGPLFLTACAAGRGWKAPDRTRRLGITLVGLAFFALWMKTNIQRSEIGTLNARIDALEGRLAR
jgi:hypothetical protein